VSEARDCLAKAAECRHKSTTSLYPSDKASWLHLADQWTRRAEKYDAPTVASAPTPTVVPVPLAPLTPVISPSWFDPALGSAVTDTC
jgi:hypothetical protein